MNPTAARITTLGLRPPSLHKGAPPRECLPTGLDSLDALTGGFPRGAISEILGPDSSGRTTLIHALLAAATAQGEICAYVDTDDSFDPVTAAASGIALSQLVWIRCGHNAGHALKATDSLLHAGGFGVIALDLCQVPARIWNRIPISYWYRFRRAVENTPTILAIAESKRTGRPGGPLCAFEEASLTKSCASLILDLERKKTAWTGAPSFSLLRGVELEIASRKPVRPKTAHLAAKAI
jgi:recA bacterial DNA recombination protein